MSDVHIGKVLQKTAKHHKLSITAIAEGAGYTQSTFYKHTIQKDLDFSILYKYAKVMDSYFEEELPDFKEYLRKNKLIEPADDAQTVQELLAQIVDLKEQVYQETKKSYRLLEEKVEALKYIDILKEKINELTSKQNKKQ